MASSIIAFIRLPVVLYIGSSVKMTSRLTDASAFTISRRFDSFSRNGLSLDDR